MTNSSSLILYHFISGSFRSISLFLLAFDPIHRAIYHIQTLPASGPHQYLATNPQKDVIYTTSWALPPTLSCWKLEHGNPWVLSHLNTVPITATSSYIDIPPPFTYIYSVGGPTGEVHVIDPNTKGFGSKTQEILFVPVDQLPHADKTRVALRYGSHAIEITSSPDYSLAFVPVLGTNTIEIYSRDPTSGSLTHLSSSNSPRGPNTHDGPRHVKIHPNGKILYSVTEHSNFVDLYEIKPTSPYLTSISSRSLLPNHFQKTSINQFRGDTLMLTPSTPKHPSPYALFTTTRGSTSETRGWLSIFALDENGYFLESKSFGEVEVEGKGKEGERRPEEVIIRHETHTSGGKANAIDILPKRKLKVLNSFGLECGCITATHHLFDTQTHWDTKLHSTAKEETEDDDDGDGDNDDNEEDEDDDDDDDEVPPRLNFPFHATVQEQYIHDHDHDHIHTYEEGEYEDEGVWILLTDDDDAIANSGKGGVQILEWDGWGGKGVRQVTSWPNDLNNSNSTNSDLKGNDGKEKEGEEQKMKGGSHAIWLV